MSSLQRSVAAAGDDGYARYQTKGGQWTLYPSVSSIALGGGVTAGYVVLGWWRFATMTIPAGSEIVSAYLRLRFDAAYTPSAPPQLHLYAIDEPDHQAPTTVSAWLTDHSMHTSASVAWTLTGGAAGTEITSPDLTALLQEVIDLPGWQSGNAIGVHVDLVGAPDFDSLVVAAYENAVYDEAILDVTYIPPPEERAGDAATGVTISAAASGEPDTPDGDGTPTVDLVITTAAEGVKTVPPIPGAAAAVVAGQTVPVRPRTLRVEDRIAGRSVAHLTITDPAGTLDLQPGMPVGIVLADDELIFSGFLAEGINVKPVSSEGSLEWDCDAIDQHYRADKKIIAGVWENMTGRAIALDIVQGWLADEGVEETDIPEDGPTITRFVMSYVPASVALGRLAELCGWWWRINHERVLQMRARGSWAAPWALTGSLWKRASVTLGSLEYRNRQWVRGGKAETEPQTELFAGDGERTTFTCGYPLSRVPTIHIDLGAGWVAQTVGIRGVEVGMDWYWNKDSEQVSQAAGGTPLGASDLLRVVYVGSYPLVTMSSDLGQQTLRSQVDGTSGIVDAVLNDPSADTLGAAFAAAASQLNLYGHTGRILRFTTLQHGLQPGMILDVDLPIAQGEFLVEQIVTICPSSEWAQHEIQAVEGPATASWADWFAANRRVEGLTAFEAIGESETLGLLEQFEEQWEWGEDVAEPLVCQCPIIGEALTVDVDVIIC